MGEKFLNNIRLSRPASFQARIPPSFAGENTPKAGKWPIQTIHAREMFKKTP
ncbi:hypothetical protein HMPREF3038_00336 [Akkermansia sp. KLE1797]|nr:hypothetical protein HMPREF3038_00336 [Akkermansia sp. KLE1797]KXU55070.1 hypothetical protein HMPREF3039_00795 [Akkermansia sp. KLE1798]KZA04298.1 hypothetical protein HMPREF1326_01966 [Akkermansia sp. KLE1605]